MTGQKSINSAPIFAAQLTPHRAMLPKAIRWVIVFTAIMASVSGILFYALGAWPVVGFLGLDVAVLWWALTKNLNDGSAFEEITLWPDQLHIRQVSARGRENIMLFNPFWVKFGADMDAGNEIVTGLHLTYRNTALARAKR